MELMAGHFLHPDAVDLADAMGGIDDEVADLENGQIVGKRLRGRGPQGRVHHRRRDRNRSHRLSA